MFFKQYNYKPRSNSQSSQSGSGSALSSSPPKEETKTQQSTTSGPVSASIAGRRRVSCVLFSPVETGIVGHRHWMNEHNPILACEKGGDSAVASSNLIFFMSQSIFVFYALGHRSFPPSHHKLTRFLPPVLGRRPIRGSEPTQTQLPRRRRW